MGRRLDHPHLPPAGHSYHLERWLEATTSEGWLVRIEWSDGRARAWIDGQEVDLDAAMAALGLA